MRYIFTAAIGTLLVIAALLAIPPLGRTETNLVAQTAGDRLAVEPDTVVTESTSPERQAVSPTLGFSETAIISEVLGVVTVPNLLTERLANRSPLVIPETTTTTTTTTTTIAPATTAIPNPETNADSTEAPATDPAAAAGDGGVIISPRGVVLPIIGAGAEGGWRVSTPCGNEVTIFEGERVTTVDFVIDPGHGGSEPGAVGPTTGVTEKSLNLRIAEIVEWYLEEAGYTVLLTRTTDVRLPLASRGAIANAINPSAFISIHHNGGVTRQQATPGTEMYVDGGNPEARRLGGLLFEETLDHLSVYEADWVGGWRNGVGTRLNSSGEDFYGIHRYTPGVPSVITEVGYLSNPSEETLFIDNEFQWSHAKAIADGLIRWRTTSDQGTGYLSDFVDDYSAGTGGFGGCTDPSL